MEYCELEKPGRPCPYCRYNRESRRVYLNHWGFWCHSIYAMRGVRIATMFVQRREQPASDGLWAFQPDPKELERWPYLLEHLGVQKYDDKKPRVTSSFSVFAEGGMLKVSFSDRDNGQVGFKSLDGLAALCDVLEEALHHGGFDWRLSRNQQPRRR